MTVTTDQTLPDPTPPARTLRDGLLLVDKDEGPTSHDVVAAARRILRQKKIGHCGTLDPTATGLLPLTVGRATRLTRFLIRAPKVYEGSARFGIATDTYDLAGEVTERKPVEGVDDEAIRAAMESFHGQYLQTPPPYCAKKVGGVKYYELARRGEAVPDHKKEVTVFDFHATGKWQGAGAEGEADLPFLLSCASGTYARSLIHELGRILGCGAVLSGLRRTRVGPFSVADAITTEVLRERLEAGESPGSAWLPFDEIPLPFAEIVADVQQERRIKNGQTVLVRSLDGREGDWIKVVDQRRKFIAVGSVVERIGDSGAGVVQPKVVFQ
jgi:tRNA pseudouridine55 synthase